MLISKRASLLQECTEDALRTHGPVWSNKTTDKMTAKTTENKTTFKTTGKQTLVSAFLYIKWDIPLAERAHSLHNMLQ